MRDDLERPQMLAHVDSGAVALPYDPNAVGSLVRRLFIETLDAQEAKGLAEYGQPLAAHNGRDAFADLLAEMIDAWQYAVQARMERDALTAALAEAQETNVRFLGLTKYLHHGPGCDSMATLPGDCACGLRGRLQTALESRP